MYKNKHTGGQVRVTTMEEKERAKKWRKKGNRCKEERITNQSRMGEREKKKE